MLYNKIYAINETKEMKTEPTESLKVLIQCVFDAYDIEGEDIENIVHYDIAKDTAMKSFKEGQSNPKIKQLEWEERKYCFAARTAFGFYKILDASIFKKRQSCTLYFSETAQKVLTGTYDECIKYAQLDYEEKVRECLITE